MAWSLSSMLFPSVGKGGQNHSLNIVSDAYAWDPNLETGSAVIDNQHKQLINALNRLFDARHYGKGHEEVKKTLTFLLKYTADHFADEEALQLKYEYPGYAAHERIHTEFTGVAVKMARDYLRAPSHAVIGEVSSAVGKWVLNHIKNEDLKMGAYILSKMKDNEKEAADKLMDSLYLWTPDLATGSIHIDNEHKQWMDALNNLFSAQRNRKGREEVKRALSFLLKYIAKHFTNEEALQEKFKYPEYPAHKQIHDEFKNVSMTMAREYVQAPSSKLIRHICDVFNQWEVHHILNHDCKLVEYIQRRKG